jgi:urease accessory protein
MIPQNGPSSLGIQPDRLTTQNIMDVVVPDKGLLLLLPDPVTCFRSASYRQVQTFRLSGDASAVLLDWVTSGRKSLGEEWAFSRYYSANEVWVNGKRIARDILLLEDQEKDVKPLWPRCLKEKLAPYSCYATMILYGSLVKGTIHDITARYDAISVFKTNIPADLIWSVSPISGATGCVVRVAGKETDIVKKWLRHSLQDIQEVVGIDTFRKAFT